GGGTDRAKGRTAESSRDPSRAQQRPEPRDPHRRAGGARGYRGDARWRRAERSRRSAQSRYDAEGHDRFGMVSGVRATRRDTFSRRLASSLANGFRRRALHDTAIDSGCGIKAFRREAFLALPYFDHQHRFMTTLMLREGYE